MALAAILLNSIQGGGGGGGAKKFSWLSKAKCSGMNKHMAWVLAMLLSWRRVW